MGNMMSFSQEQIAEESEETVLHLVLGRLRYPYQLSAKAEESYREYLAGHLKTAARMLVEEEDMEGLRFFSEKDLWTRPSINAALERAAELKKTEITALLYRREGIKVPCEKEEF